MSDTDYMQIVVPFPEIQRLYMLLIGCAETGVYYDGLITMLMLAFNNGADLNDMLSMAEDYTLPLETDYPDTRKSVMDILVRFIGVMYQYIVLADIVTPVRSWGLETDAIRITSGGFDEYNGVTKIAGYYRE